MQPYLLLLAPAFLVGVFLFLFFVLSRESFERQVLHSQAKVEVQLAVNTREMELLRRETSLITMEMGRQQHPAQEDTLEGLILPLNRAVLKRPASVADRHDVEEHMKIWIRGSADRNGGGKRRK
ncbi:hypothetical protein CAPTEDRAFT_197345 [Capitella teleta]|uniref:Uncharacterized protein n=1 Tax=Capitella teleta TaxID=283909 RepID=R7TPT4_CAPTE|nr:hypothetical protein CAPTEDRAFT_197345 [Capitella teleta]|eukprot:ELT95669.1 hypothetical protein CAPTEDRAFT_197345 [Capitella teleta]